MPPDFHPIQLITDQPISGQDGSDLLGMKPFAKVLAGVALGTAGPFNIGVYGGWGVGKTSMLRHVKSLIESENNPNVVTVWFNPWQFECEEHPLFPLTAAIVRALDDHLKAHTGADARAHGWLASVHRTLRAVAYASSFEFGAGVAKVKIDGAKAVDREEALQPKNLFDDQIRYQAAFSALERCSEAMDDTARIVVFVDDLDRCQPKNALKLLEAIKLALGQKGFIFFLAVDNEIIEGYLTHAYSQELALDTAGDGDNDAPYRRLAERYLHKLVQMDFPLPSHIAERFDDYLRALVTTDMAEEERRGELVSILRMGTAANPRSAVRMLNRLEVQWHLWNTMRMDAPEGLTAKQMPLLMAFSDVLLDRLGPRPFEQLVGDEEACQALLTLRTADEDITEAPLSESAKLIVEPLRKERKALEALFDSHVARLWLTNADLRKAIHTFFQKTEAISEAPESQQVIVDRAIRNALQLAVDSPVTDQQRTEVAALDLTRQRDFSDAGMALVARLTRLQDLTLEGTPISDIGIAHLFDLTSLHSLNLAFTRVTDGGLLHLKNVLSLESLSLAYTKVKDKGLENVRTLTALRSLDLTATKVTDGGLAHLQQLTSLHSLNLASTQVSDAGLEQISCLTELQELDLSGAAIADAGLAHISGLAELTELNLIRTNVGDVGLAHLEQFAKLRRLLLQGLLISDAGLAHLKALTALQFLWLRSTAITDTGLAQLKGLASLQELWVQETDVSDAGLAQLKDLVALRKLCLSGTQVSDAGLVHLEGLSGLRDISLSGKRISDGGMVTLSRLADLEAISLHGAAVTDLGLTHLAKLTKLRSLWLSFTQVSDAGLKHLSALAGLEWVRLDGTRVTRPGVKALQRALPNCRVLWDIPERKRRHRETS